MRSSLLILDLKDGKLSDSGNQEVGKTFHKLHVLGMNGDLWDRVREVGSRKNRRRLVSCPHSIMTFDFPCRSSVAATC